ncbi:SIR2 family protein [Ornithobacterium rhinotracheale]|uniref:SIR2 family protein n=1 Tax=Ornithobacterium rhinotracheale TaxID=28251 RepID=UPI003FD1131B
MENNNIYFYKGKENLFEKENKDSFRKIQEAFLKVLDNKNLSFLLGSGCSSYEKVEEGESSSDESQEDIQSEESNEVGSSSNEDMKSKQKETISKDDDEKQIGIPVMIPMAEEFYNSDDFSKDKKWLKTELDIDVESDKHDFKKNLESFLSTLHSLSFYYSKIHIESDKKEENNEIKKADRINEIIVKTRNFILKKCLNEKNIRGGKDKELVDIYKTFYKKLLTRNPTLPRLNIFTTNYDLYSERAMDSLGIHYVNGFTGGISKYFNPTIFNYALAEKMDLSQSKWSVIDNFFYLYKIHGSVNWIEDDSKEKLFKVKEIQDPTFDKLKEEQTIMIHPTPLKYNASLGSPYSDLFREFQKKLMQNNNILVTIGYSFSDEHINNLIFQAFTIPSFRLIVIGEPKDWNAIGKLKKLDDPRIWIIGGTDNKEIPLHYFKRFVEETLPDLTNEDLDEKMEKTLKELLRC